MRALLRDAQDQTRIALEVEECPDSNATINDKRDTRKGYPSCFS